MLHKPIRLSPFIERGEQRPQLAPRPIKAQSRKCALSFVIIYNEERSRRFQHMNSGQNPLSMNEEDIQSIVPSGAQQEFSTAFNADQSCYLTSLDPSYCLLSAPAPPDTGWWGCVDSSSSLWGWGLPYQSHYDGLFQDARYHIWSAPDFNDFSLLNGSSEPLGHWGFWDDSRTPFVLPDSGSECQVSSHLVQASAADLGSSESSLITKPRIDIKHEPPPLPSFSQDPSLTPNIVTKHDAEHQSTVPPWIKREQAHKQLPFITSRGQPAEEVAKDEKCYRCEACTVRFATRKNLDRHRNTIHAEKSSRKVCPHESCDKTFIRQDNLTVHIRKYHGEPTRPAGSTTFPSPSPSKSRSCHKRTFNDELSLSSASDISHLTLPKRQPTFNCKNKNCTRHEKGFRSPSDLRRHERDVHRRFSNSESHNGYMCASEHCPTPGKTWSRLDNLRTHIHKLHGNENIPDLIARSSLPLIELQPKDDRTRGFVLYTSKG
ncbi:hypothetical protein BDV11DRAFT_127791 [Aspergillus similis]